MVHIISVFLSTCPGALFTRVDSTVAVCSGSSAEGSLAGRLEYILTMVKDKFLTLFADEIAVQFSNRTINYAATGPEIAASLSDNS